MDFINTPIGKGLSVSEALRPLIASKAEQTFFSSLFLCIIATVPT